MNLVSRPWSPRFPSHKLDRSSPLFDAFGRLRTSTIETIFDSKLSFGKLTEYWDEVVSANASSTHIDVNSCVNMSVTANGAYVIRQTRQRWNYQPGKSQALACTFKMPVSAGVVSRVGMMHGNYAAPHTVHDGLFFEVADGVASCNIVHGSEIAGIVGTEKALQSEWNIDKLDGTGPSGKVADWSRCQILQVDYQWLGVGGVRFGFEVDSVMVYVHEFFHAGVTDVVYMHNGSQCVRYEIRSTGGSGTMSHICSSVMSEGGLQKTGITTTADTDGVLVSCPAGAIQMLLAMRIDPANPDLQLLVEKVYTLNTAANTNYRWTLTLNPTITGTPNWVAIPNSSLQQWQNAGTSITMTGGILLDAGYASRDSRQVNVPTNPAINPGVSIAGVADILALGIESIGGTSSCAGGIGIRQLI